MSAGTYDLEIEKGATFNLDIDYKDSSDALYDLSSNYTIKMYIRVNSGGELIDSNDPGETTNNITVTLNNISPNIKIEIPHSITDTYSFETAIYSLELTNTVSNEVNRLLQGQVALDLGA